MERTMTGNGLPVGFNWKIVIKMQVSRTFLVFNLLTVIHVLHGL